MTKVTKPLAGVKHIKAKKEYRLKPLALTLSYEEFINLPYYPNVKCLNRNKH